MYAPEPQLEYLVGRLSQANLTQTQSSVDEILTDFGFEARHHLFECLLKHVIASDLKSASKPSLQAQMLTRRLQHLDKDDVVLAAITYAAHKTADAMGNCTTVLPQVFKALKLTDLQQVLVCNELALSEHSKLAAAAVSILKAVLPQLASAFKGIHCEEAAMHKVLFLVQDPQYGVPAEARKLFLTAVRPDGPASSLIFRPLLASPLADPIVKPASSEETNAIVQSALRQFDLASVMFELGYSCCTSTSINELMSQFEASQLTPSLVAQAIGMMAHTTSGLEDNITLHTALQDGVAWEKQDKPAPAKDKDAAWNVEVFVAAIKSKAPDLNWKAVIQALDYPGFSISDLRGLSVITSAFQQASTAPFPIDALCSKWQNKGGQLSVLRLLVQPANAGDPEVAKLLAMPMRRVPRDGIKNINDRDPATMPWLSLDIIRALAHASVGDQFSSVRDLVLLGVRACPELVAVGLVHCEPFTPLHEDVFLNHLFKLFFPPHTNSSVVFNQLWQTKPGLVLHGAEQWYLTEPTDVRLDRILDLARDIKALPRLLMAKNQDFVIHLAVVANRRNFLNLGTWLENQASMPTLPQLKRAAAALLTTLPPGVQQGPGLAALQQWLVREGAGMAPAAGGPPGFGGAGMVAAPVAVGAPHGTYLEQLHSQNSLARSRNVSIPPLAPVDSTESMASSGPSTPLQYGPPGSDPAGGGADATDLSKQKFSDETDEQANQYFKKIYTSEISIDEIVQLLNRFKHSPHQKERDIFNCMIRNLFDEYQYFPQYPDKELGITGILFGSLVQHRLVDYNPLATALKDVLDALRKEPKTKMHLFGLCALDRFKERLYEWPRYCTPITQIPHFATFPPDVKLACEAGKLGKKATEAAAGPNGGGAAGADPAAAAAGGGSLAPLGGASPNTSPSPAPFVPGQVPGKGTSPFTSSGDAFGLNSTSLNTLVDAAAASNYLQPAERIQDRVQIIFNNISETNLAQKSAELKGLVQEDHLHWLGQYVVVKRASIEPNYHQLYIKFMDALALPPFNKALLRETYLYIKVLLKSKSIASNSSERALLKNLGSWLGLQTLARDRPILHRDIALKDLVVFAYEMGSRNLLYVIPFVRRVFDACQYSRVFKPPNPWTMATLRLFKELHQMHTLKLNLKFEIEVLCNHLQLSIDAIEPSTLLQDIVQMPPQGLRSSPSDGAAQHSPGMSGPASSPFVPAEALGPSVLPRKAVYPGLSPSSVASLQQYIVFNGSITLFQQQPRLKQYVQVAIERAIQDLIQPVVERAVKIACISSQKLIAKDFALEPEGARLSKAAQIMVQHLAGSLAMVFSKDPLRMNITSQLRNFLASQVVNAPDQKPTQAQILLIDQAVALTCGENLDLACAFIEKSAMERAVPEINDALLEELAERRRYQQQGAAAAGQPFCDTKNFYHAASSLPARLQPKVGGLDGSQFSLYEMFARLAAAPLPQQLGLGPGLPTGPGGFAPPSKDDLGLGGGGGVAGPGQQQGQGPPPLHQQTQQPQPPGMLGGPGAAPAPGSAAQALDELLRKIEARGQSAMGMELSQIPGHHELHTLMREFHALVGQTRQPRVCHKVFVLLAEATAAQNKLLGDVHFVILLHLLETYHGLVTKEVTKAYLQNEIERAVVVPSELVVKLLRARLLDPLEVDVYFHKIMDFGRNYRVVVFVEDLLRQCLLTEPRVPHLTQNEFPRTIDLLAKISSAKSGGSAGGAPGVAGSVGSGPPPSAGGGPEGGATVGGGAPGTAAVGGGTAAGTGLQDVVAQLRKAGGRAAALVHEEPDDPPGLRDRVCFLFDEWLRLVGAQAKPDREGRFVQRLQQQNMLKTDDISTRFFRMAAEYAVRLCFSGDSPQQVTQFHCVDAFTALVVVLLKHFGESTKEALINKVLATVTAVILRHHGTLGAKFNQKPYCRLFSNLLLDVHSTDEALAFRVLSAFSGTFHSLRPAAAPGFTFAWLELVSHRNFMPRLLQLKKEQHKSWQMLQLLFVDLFTYMAPLLRGGELGAAVKMLYTGTLRVLLVLLHDFPEFLCEFHFSFCDVIPPTCIQMRNLILSAFPRNQRLPDPFSPNLKLDVLAEQLPDVNNPPRILASYVAVLDATGLRRDIDTYFRTRKPVPFLLGLGSRLVLPSPEEAAAAGTRYNVPVLNALVLYVGVKAIEQVKSSGGEFTITHGAPMDIYQHLAVDLDPEGRYLFFNAIANHLRYPNSHTHYFCCVLLFLFAQANKDIIQEQVTRVLLERLIVNRPHPWGLLVTFMELIKNPSYKFWQHDFIHCAPDIERLIKSVASSCMHKQAASQTQMDREQQRRQMDDGSSIGGGEMAPTSPAPHAR